MKKMRIDLSDNFEFYLKAYKPNLLNKCEREFRFHKTRKWRFDFAWPDLKIAVEIDGGQFKKFGGRHARDSDREKLNEAVLLGWSVLRFSGEMIKKSSTECIDLLENLIKIRESYKKNK